VARRPSTQPSRRRTHGLIGRVSRSPGGYASQHSHVWFDTADDVRLAGTHLAGAGGDVGVVVVHGFNGYRTKPRIRTLAEGLARRFPVLVFDLRGHGQSAGWCSGGELEALDVLAAVEYMRKRGYRRVVTVGASLGGIAVIRAAAVDGAADAVVAISTPARWGTSETKAVRRMTWIFTSPIGRSMFRRLFGTRINLDWGNPDPPVEAIARVHAPLLLIHGEDDHFFSARDAEELYANAPDPKRLLLLPRFGHAEDGFSDAFAATLADEIAALVALAPGAPERIPQ
jgi:uncharacterized protein